MLNLRAADATDSRSIWEWRNDPVSRSASLDSTAVPWEDHERWYAATLANPERLILVATDGEGDRLGMVRFDFDGPGSATVSINVAPEQRGRGTGGELLRAAIESVRSGRPAIGLVAQIRATNAASIRIFERAGFGGATEAEGVITLTAPAV